jgi:hypothetical protein
MLGAELLDDRLDLPLLDLHDGVHTKGDVEVVLDEDAELLGVRGWAHVDVDDAVAPGADAVVAWALNCTSKAALAEDSWVFEDVAFVTCRGVRVGAAAGAEGCGHQDRSAHDDGDDAAHDFLLYCCIVLILIY